MAVRTYVGTNNGWSWDGTPAAGDELVVTGVSKPLTTGLNQSTLDVLRMTVHADSSFLFGTPASPLQLQIDQTGTGLLEYYGQGRGDGCFITPGGAANEITRIRWLPSNGQTKLGISLGLFPIVDLGAGRLDVAGDAEVDRLHIAQGATGVIIAADSINDPSIVEVAGSLHTARAMDELRTRPTGTVEFSVPETLPLLVMGGGRLKWRGGAIQAADLDAGVLDLSDAIEDVTLGSATDGSLRVARGFTIIPPPAGISLTIADDKWIPKYGRASVLN